MFLSSGAAVVAAGPAPAQAKDEVFRSNPLTNPVLEKIRIWEQAEADELRYGGELERGDAGNRGNVEAYPALLVPIVRIADELGSVNQMVHSKDDWAEVQRILRKPEYQKVGFKKVFNAYGDNIYYSDPDRANAYLGGGATPSNEQSMAYLLRNDVLTNVEALRAEVDYLVGHPEEQGDTDDLYGYANGAAAGMQQYLDEIVPPEQLKRAEEILASSSELAR